YTGTYSIKFLVNGTEMGRRDVTVAASCAPVVPPPVVPPPVVPPPVVPPPGVPPPVVPPPVVPPPVVPPPVVPPPVVPPPVVPPPAVPPPAVPPPVVPPPAVPPPEPPPVAPASSGVQWPESLHCCTSRPKSKHPLRASASASEALIARPPEAGRARRRVPRL